MVDFPLLCYIAFLGGYKPLVLVVLQPAKSRLAMRYSNMLGPYLGAQKLASKLLPSGRLTWQYRNTFFDRKRIFKWSTFHCYQIQSEKVIASDNHCFGASSEGLRPLLYVVVSNQLKHISHT